MRRECGPRRRDGVFSIGFALIGLVATAAFAGSVMLERRASDSGRQMSRLNGQTPAALGPHIEQSSASDFTRRLPHTPAAAPLLEELRRAASETGVTLSSLTTDVRKPTERTLGR